MPLIVSACGPAGASSLGDKGAEDTSGGGPDESSQLEASSSDNVFLPPEEDSPTECDPWVQDCGPGDKCVPYASRGSAWNANKCVPVTGNRAPGEPCVHDGVNAGTDDCDASGMCWYVEEVDGELLGVCVPFCQGTADAPLCPEDHYCPVNGDGAINVCLPTCDPVTQDCDIGQCSWNGKMFTCTLTAQEIPIGQPCGYINDCAMGLMCVAMELVPDCAGSACCTAFCDLGLGDAQCEALPGTSCVPFFEAGMELPGYVHVGICVIPWP